MTAIMGGPMPPNYEGMTVEEKKCAKEEYERKRKEEREPRVDYRQAWQER